jgi:glutamate racemase
MKDRSPIVVLDSGLGGLTVVAAMRQVLPQDDIIYFGDTARLPYGCKTAATVTLCVHQIIAYLRSFSPKHVVIACNTATALAMPAIRQSFPDLSISGVIEPGARAAVDAAGNLAVPTIGIIATEATIRSKAYDRAILRRRQHARLVLKPTPLLVPIIEEGRGTDDPLVRLALAQYLTPLVHRGIDVLVLGCTHYPILRKLVVEMVGSKVAVIDSAAHCAEDVAARLAQRKLLRSSANGTPGEAPLGTLRCFVTDDSPRFAALAARFLGMPIDSPTWVSLDELAAVGQSLVPV